MNLLSEHKFVIEWWPIEQPVDYPKNARKWSEIGLNINGRTSRLRLKKSGRVII